MKLAMASSATPLAAEEAASHRSRDAIAYVGGTIALGLVVLAAAGVGKVAIPFDDLAGIVANRIFGVPVVADWPPSHESILLEIRLPRVLLGVLVGSALAVAGATYQGLFRNPLGDPYLLGVAAGAALGAVLAYTLLPTSWLLGIGAVQGAAFLGALVTVSAVAFLARSGGATPTTTLILAGVALGSLASAATTYLMYATGEQLLVIYTWMLGGFNVATWSDVIVIAPLVALSVVVLAGSGRVLNALQLGEEQAASLGIDVERAKLTLVGVATLATASAVSTSGLIGFVGLIVPHLVRLVAGPDHRRLIPLSGLVGGAFLVIADAFARSLPGSSELPVGIVTAACGAPFFLFLLKRHQRSLF